MDHLKPLTSLRFAAAAMIVAYHAASYVPALRHLGEWPFKQGVSFFFVLSGFVLSHAYAGRAIGFGHFVTLRLARLWPVHFVTALMVIFLMRPDSRQFPGTGWFSPWLALAANLTLTQSLPPFPLYVFSWNAVSWSISTEFFFYLAFLFLLRELHRNWHWKLLLAAALLLGVAGIAALAGLPMTGGITEASTRMLVYASPLARGFEFVLGMVAWLAWTRLGRLRLGLIGGTALELAALALLAGWFLGGQAALRPLFAWSGGLAYWFEIGGGCLVFAPLLMAFASAQGVVGRMLSLQPFLWLGGVSFCLYMVHQLVMKWFFIKQLEGVIQTLPLLPILALCLLLAAALHHGVERPCQRWLVGRIERRQGAKRLAGPGSVA
ncbi:acyltransferase [Roseococcus sp. SDR]|uniref:acyltransferase family protein n=1 Tax=Roseococcus sp. SDR TaxID=2835532 RepID=UPI001BCC0EBC|nr:acyltransferase [Roseococcus sp. SDR]MBS7789679.1 acyltransferase [Roseococcus sp. SDR]MBV1844993.1 acyltransferase [Roseococcus sp. SDR]